MKKLLLIVILALSVLSPLNASESEKEALYIAYKQSSRHQLYDLLTPRYQKELLNGRKNTPDVIDLISAKISPYFSNITKEINHFESFSKDHACLLVNGFTNDKQKVSLYIKYDKQSIWLVDNIIFEYIEAPADFLSEAICDSWQLQQKRMEAWEK